MSTTQGPYTVTPLVSRTSLHQIVGPGMPLEQVATQENHLNFYWRTSDDVVSLTVRAQRLNAAYAEGQRSKQADLDEAYLKLSDAEARAEHNAAHGIETREKLDKAVELLREVGYFITDHCPDNPFADELNEKIDAYLSTLTPQPDAAQ